MRKEEQWQGNPVQEVKSAVEERVGDWVEGENTALWEHPSERSKAGVIIVERE